MAFNYEDQTILFNFVVKQGNGVKGLIDSGMSCVTQPFVQPPAERIATLNAHTSEATQPIDLSQLDGPRHKEVATQIVEAAETLGFFQVVNHGVSVELLELLKTSAHAVFAQPPEKKAIYLKEMSPSKLVKYGTSFVPEKEKAIDWKDYVSIIYTNDHEALQHWPQLCRLDNGDLAEIPPLNGALVINVGDTLQIPSNGKYKSAEHRVRTTNIGSRVPVPIFTAPNPSEKIVPLPEVVKRDGVARYKELLFQDYMKNFFSQPHDGKKSLDFARVD
ncbi:hypothetical protein Bca101_060326 [Brassica carinata]